MQLIDLSQASTKRFGTLKSGLNRNCTLYTDSTSWTVEKEWKRKRRDKKKSHDHNANKNKQNQSEVTNYLDTCSELDDEIFNGKWMAMKWKVIEVRAHICRMWTMAILYFDCVFTHMILHLNHSYFQRTISTPFTRLLFVSEAANQQLKSVQCTNIEYHQKHQLKLLVVNCRILIDQLSKTFYRSIHVRYSWFNDCCCCCCPLV